MKRVGIIGTSGFAREVKDIAVATGFSPVFLAKDQAVIDAWTLPDEIILESAAANYRDMPLAFGIGENALRHCIWERLKRDFRFVNMIHPSASFGFGQREAVDAAAGVVICAGARLTNNIKVGSFTVFNLNVTIGHDCIIDDFANLAPGANVSGNVHIGARCWIGTGATIIQGTETRKLVIGSDTVIGAGSVVLRDCDADSVYLGLPARKVR